MNMTALYLDTPLPFEWQEMVVTRLGDRSVFLAIDDVAGPKNAQKAGARLSRGYEKSVERRFFSPRETAFAPGEIPAHLPIVRRSGGEAAFWDTLAGAGAIVSLALCGPFEILAHCQVPVLQFMVERPAGWDYTSNVRDVLAGLPQTGYGFYAFHAARPGRRATVVQSHTRTERASQWKNKNTYCWRAADFCLRALDKLEREDIESWTWQGWAPPRHSLPLAAAQAAGLAGRAAAKKLHFALRNTRWGTVCGNYQGLGQPVQLRGRLAPPPGSIWVDPFVAHHGGRTHVFFENLVLGEQAAIWVSEVNEGGACTPPVPALREDFHLSFPNVFEMDGRWYMLPETIGAKQVRLYECVEFPGKWKLAAVLMDNILASDPVLHRHGGRWWLFLCEVGHEGMPFDDELSLYHTEDLLSGRWMPHPANPVVSDVRRARMAGNLFREGGRLIRPAQDCAGEYGRGMNFYEVTHLSPEHYEETLYKPGTELFTRPLSHMHTFSKSGSLCVVDAILPAR